MALKWLCVKGERSVTLEDGSKVVLRYVEGTFPRLWETRVDGKLVRSACALKHAQNVKCPTIAQWRARALAAEASRGEWLEHRNAAIDRAEAAELTLASLRSWAEDVPRPRDLSAYQEGMADAANRVLDLLEVKS